MTTTEAEIDYKEREHQWAEALREPQRRQCSEQLGEVKDGQVVSQCCLDVLCELAEVPWVATGRTSVRRQDVDGDSFSTTGLTWTAQQWLGVAMSDPILDIPDRYLRSQGCDDPCHVHDYDDECRLPDRLENVSAAILNDDWDLTFPQIADMVDYFGLVRR